MKYSVSSWIYGDQEIEKTFNILQELGFNAIELNGDPSAYPVERILELIQKYHIPVTSLAGYFPWPTTERDLSNPDPEIRKKAISYLRDCCNYARQIGASIIIVSPTPVGKVLPTTDFGDEGSWSNAVSTERDLAISSIREASKYAEETNVILAIEPLNRYETFLVNNVHQALSFIRKVNSPAVRLHLDTFHMNIEEVNLPDAFSTGKEYLVNVHMADSNRQAIGRGHIEFNRIVEALNEMNYQGPLTLEPLPPISNPYLAANIESFRKILYTYLRESITNLKALSKENA